MAIFTKVNCYVLKQGQLIIHDNQHKSDGLWDVKLPSTNTSYPWHHYHNTMRSTYYIITKDKTKNDLAQYLHGATFSPRISIFTKIINNGNIVTWPGIGNSDFYKLLGTRSEIELEHLDQERENAFTKGY